MSLHLNAGRSFAQSILLDIIAFGFTFVLILATKIPVLSGYSQLEMTLYLIPLFIWIREGAHNYSMGLIFALGIIQDIFSGAPLGFWSVTFGLFCAGLNTQSGLFLLRSRIVDWLLFSGACGLVYVMFWFTLTSYSAWTVTFPVFLRAFLMTIILYFPIRWLMLLCVRWVLREGT